MCLLEILRDRVEDGSAGQQSLKAVQYLKMRSGPLELLQHTLESLVEKLVPSSKILRTIQSFSWILEKAEVEDLLATIARHKQAIQIALQSDHLYVYLIGFDKR
jgi:hypothetical protein